MIKTDFIKTYEELETLNEDYDPAFKPHYYDLTPDQEDQIRRELGEGFVSGFRAYRVASMTLWTFDLFLKSKDNIKRNRQVFENAVFNDQRVKECLANNPDIKITTELVSCKYNPYASEGGRYKVAVKDKPRIELRFMCNFGSEKVFCAIVEQTVDADGKVSDIYQCYDDVYGQYFSYQPFDKAVEYVVNRILARANSDYKKEYDRQQAIDAIYSEPYIDGRYNGD